MGCCQGHGDGGSGDPKTPLRGQETTATNILDSHNPPRLGRVSGFCLAAGTAWFSSEMACEFQIA